MTEVLRPPQTYRHPWLLGLRCILKKYVEPWSTIAKGKKIQLEGISDQLLK